MAYFHKQEMFEDWCHICGHRQARNVEVWYPSNAEHEFVDNQITGSHHYLRICGPCGEVIARLSTGHGDKSAIRNNPALRLRAK